MTVPEFPSSVKTKKLLEASQQPILQPITYAQQIEQQQLQRKEPAIYSTVVTSKQDQSSLRREPDPSPPPPLPSSQPPPIVNQDRTFVDELKQRNLRHQRQE